MAEYFLIAFLIVVVLSPLAWLKSSPGQQRVTRFRRRAAELGLRVQLVPAPDAEETATRPEAVRYFLPYPSDSRGESSASVGTWTLIRHHRRGRESPWPEWKWFRGESPAACHQLIARAISRLPEAANAIRADAAGIAVYLRETGEVSAVDQVAESLKILRGA